MFTQWRISQTLIVHFSGLLVCYFILQVYTQFCVYSKGKYVPEITAATVMGTTCCPFNFIHVRGGGCKVSSIRQSSLSDNHCSACEKTMTSQTLLLRQHHFIHAHTYTHTTQTSRTHGPLSKTQQGEWSREEGGAVGESHSKLHCGGATSASDVRRLPPSSSPSCGTFQIDVRGI